MFYPLRSILFIVLLVFSFNSHATEKRLAYLVSDLRIPFWNIMWKGIETRGQQLGYDIQVFSAENDNKTELENAVKAIRAEVDGIILSPINSSAAVTVLKLAKKAHIPVVISDIGTQSGEYVSYIESDNLEGAYQLGNILAEALHAKDWKNGHVGIIAIPQKRMNGRLRTQGFLSALDEFDIVTADIRQQVDFSYSETYNFSTELINKHPDLRAIWLQGSDRYQAALDAIRNTGKEGNILLICFDAEPEFIDMISNGRLAGAGMQQPFLMGEKAAQSLHDHLQGKTVALKQHVEVLAVSAENIQSLLPLIKRNVLGQEPL